MKFKILFALLVAPLFIIIATNSVYSAMYKYQDEKGIWVYSQHPPASGDFTIIKAQRPSRSSSLNSEARKAKINKARDAILGNKQTSSKVQQETDKNEAKRQTICEKSKKGLEALQIYRRFRDKDGNITFLDDDVRAQRIRDAQDNIEQFCK